jgi:hypothetical protein
MKYEIKNFDEVDANKIIGFWVTDINGRKLAIDKTIPVVAGKTQEQYTQEAFALCKDEIEEWANSMAIIGRVWNPETNSFE